MINFLKVNNRGFNTIELITTCLIIGILVLLASPDMLNYATMATEARQKHEDKVVRDIAIFQYYAKEGKMPDGSEFINSNKMINLTYTNDEEGNQITKNGVTIVHEGYLTDPKIIHIDSKYYKLPNRFLSNVLDRPIEGYYYYDMKTGNLFYI